MTGGRHAKGQAKRKDDAPADGRISGSSPRHGSSNGKRPTTRATPERRAETQPTRSPKLNPLRALREGQRWTAKDLAKRAGIPTSAVYRMEAGNPMRWSVRLLVRLSGAFGVPVETVLGLRPDVPVRVDELGRQDRELLDAMQRDAEALIGPQVMRACGLDWRSLARSSWLGLLFGLRDGRRYFVAAQETKHPALPPAGKQPKPPREWFTSWESPRQQARAALPPRSESRKALAGRKNRALPKGGTP